MADKKLSIKQIGIAYVSGTVITGITGYAIADVLTAWGYRPDYWLMMEMTWLTFVGVPSMAVVSDTILKALGKKSPIQIINNAANGQGRKVPINYGGGRQSHVFLSALPMIGSRQPEPIEPPQIPQSFTVIMDDKHYQVPVTEIRDFLHTSWQRQRQGKPAFSRNWWTKTRRPKMHEKQYRALMLVLDQIPNLVLNRGQGRSGQLALPPEATVKTLQGLM